MCENLFESLGRMFRLLALFMMFSGWMAISANALEFQKPNGPPGLESETPPSLMPQNAPPDSMIVESRIDPTRPTIEMVGPIQSAASSEMIERFFFIDESLHQVLRFYAELSGLKVIAPSSLPSIAVTFDSGGTLSKEDAIVALESLLQVNDISVASLGDKFIRVLPASSIRYKSPDFVDGSSLTLSPSEKIYTKLFAFSYLKPEEGLTILGNMLTQGIGHLEPLKSSNSCLVTDSLVNIQKMERLLRRLDVPSEKVTIVRKLLHTTASELQSRMQVMLDEPLKPFIQGTVNLTADDRTNYLVIVTHPANQKMLESLLNSYDEDVLPVVINEVFYLKHAQSEAVVALMRELIASLQEQSKLTGGGKRTNEAQRRQDVPPGFVDPSVSSSDGGNAKEGTTVSKFLSLVSDERSNSIIFTGTQRDQVFVREILDRLDVLLPQVRIDVVITEVTLSNENNRGIERFGIQYDENDELTFSINENTSMPFSLQGGVTDLLLRSMALREFSLGAVFDTANRDSNVRVISAPTLVTTHNREAIINAGESRPVITASNTDSTGLSTRSQVQFRDIGVQLKVKPLIGSNNMVQLEIQQTVENVVDEVLIDGNSQPIIGKREAVSFVSVGSGEIIVLGGLQERISRDAKGRMSFFGSIPVIGRLLFSNNRDSKTTRELIIFIKPTVYADAVSAYQASSEKWAITNEVLKNELMELKPDVFEKPSSEIDVEEVLDDETLQFRFDGARRKWR